MPTLVHIVDDDASFRVSAGRLLRACGYEVSMYESADQLLERVPEDNGASCILLDVNIPGLSGPQLRERLAMLGSSMPVVFLTGNDENLASLQPAKSSVEEFLTKPIRREKLIHAIERAVAHSWDRREKADRLKALVREC